MKMTRVVRKTTGAAPPEASNLLMSDIARIAGVATSTVSRALANPGRVNEKTRRRIAAVVEKLGYTPNAAAHALRAGKSKVVMIILPGPLFSGASQVISEVLGSIGPALVKNSFNLMIANLDRTVETEKHILDLAFSGTIRGIIMLSSELPRSGSRTLLEAHVPIVSLLLDLSENGIKSVVANEREAIRAATQHLIDLGHRNFFYIAAPSNSFHEVERFSGLTDALASARIGRKSIIRFENNRDFSRGLEVGVEAGHKFLSLATRPTAALCYSDDAAIAFMSTVQQAGISVPSQLSVVGFDGAAVGAFCSPALTTVQQPTAALGAQAADMLLKILIEERHDLPAKLVLPCRLLIRGSTAPNPKSLQL